MQFCSAVALLICAGLFAQPHAALVKSQTAGFLSTKGLPAVPAVPAVAAVPAQPAQPAHPAQPAVAAVPAVPAVHRCPNVRKPEYHRNLAKLGNAKVSPERVQISGCQSIAGAGSPFGYTLATCGKEMHDLRGDTINFDPSVGRCDVKKCGSSDIMYHDHHNQVYEVYSTFCEKAEHKEESVEVTVDGYGETKVRELVNRTSITYETQTACVCPLGQFWHFISKKCMDQGGWGYECGFFPFAHAKNVCQDGLVCRQTAAAQDSDDGKHGSASCMPCTAEDKCLKGETRQTHQCMKQNIMHGKACTQVKVTLSVTGFAEAEQQEKYDVNVVDAATVESKATASVTAKATTSSEVEKTVTAKAAAKSTHETKMTVTVDGKTVDRIVIGHGSADATATSTAIGKAVEQATVTSEAQGSAKVTQSVKQWASAKEWGKGKASGQTGDATSNACVTIDEVRGELGLAKGQRVGPVWAARIISKGDQMAMAAAHQKAIKAAIKESKTNTKEAAVAAAEAEAQQNARLAAEAKALETAAWRAEAGASTMAAQLAEAEAIKKATAQVKSGAIKKAEAEAEKVASNRALVKAGSEASEEAQSRANDLAKKEAESISLKTASAQAKKDVDSSEISRAAAEKIAIASKAQAGELAKKHAKAEEALAKLEKADWKKKEAQKKEEEAAEQLGVKATPISAKYAPVYMIH